MASGGSPALHSLKKAIGIIYIYRFQQEMQNKFNKDAKPVVNYLLIGIYESKIFPGNLGKIY